MRPKKQNSNVKTTFACFFVFVAKSTVWTIWNVGNLKYKAKTILSFSRWNVFSFTFESHSKGTSNILAWLAGCCFFFTSLLLFFFGNQEKVTAQLKTRPTEIGTIWSDDEPTNFEPKHLLKRHWANEFKTKEFVADTI